MTNLSELQRATFAKLDVRMSELGFQRLRRFAYVSRMGPDAVAYVFCRPKKAGESFDIAPIVAVENLKLRALMGEDEPRQDEPRFANLYLAHTVGRVHMSWNFSEVCNLGRELESMIDAILIGAIPFAQKWATFEGAINLIELAWAGRAPNGVVVHPTARTAQVLRTLRA